MLGLGWRFALLNSGKKLSVQLIYKLSMKFLRKHVNSVPKDSSLSV